MKKLVTLDEIACYLTEIKKSRFLAQALRVENPEEALTMLEKHSDSDATHNCWAYRIEDQYRFSDDGEPGGSAGRPILMAIEGQGLDHILVIVTRYFGGIKLGVGGLVRAYGGTASECLRQASRIEVRPTVEIEIKISFKHAGQVYLLLEEIGGIKLGEVFGEDGPRIQVQIEESQIETLRMRVRDISRGQAIIHLKTSG